MTLDALPATKEVAVRAIADGILVFTQRNGQDDGHGYGYVAVLKHKNGCYSFYSHLAKPALTSLNSSNAARVGQEFKAGEALGVLYAKDEYHCAAPTGNIRRVYTESNLHTHFALIQLPTNANIDANERNNGRRITDLFFERADGKPNGRWLNPEPLLRRLKFAIREDLMSAIMPCTDQIATDPGLSAARLQAVVEKKFANGWPTISAQAVEEYRYRSQQGRAIASVGNAAVNAQLLAVKALMDLKASGATNAEKLKSSLLKPVHAAAAGCVADSECQARVTLLSGGLQGTVVSDMIEVAKLGPSARVKLLQSLARDGFADVVNDPKIAGATGQRILSLVMAEASTTEVALAAAAGIVKVTNMNLDKHLTKLNAAKQDLQTLAASANRLQEMNMTSLQGVSDSVQTVQSALNGLRQVGIAIPVQLAKALDTAEKANRSINVGMKIVSAFSAGANPMAAIGALSALGGSGFGGGPSGPDPAIMGALNDIKEKLEAMDLKLDVILANQKRIIEKIDLLDSRIVQLNSAMMKGFERIETGVARLDKLMFDQRLTRIASCMSAADRVSDMLGGITPGAPEILDAESRKTIGETLGKLVTHEEIRNCLDTGLKEQFLRRCAIAEAYYERTNEKAVLELQRKFGVLGRVTGLCPADGCAITKGASTSPEFSLRPEMSVVAYDLGAAAPTYDALQAKWSAVLAPLQLNGMDTATQDRVIEACSYNPQGTLRIEVLSNFVRASALPLKSAAVLLAVDDLLKILPYSAQAAIADPANAAVPAPEKSLKHLLDALEYVRNAKFMIRTLMGQLVASDGDMLLEAAARQLTRNRATNTPSFIVATDYERPTYQALFDYALPLERSYFHENLGKHLVYQAKVSALAFDFALCEDARCASMRHVLDIGCDLSRGTPECNAAPWSAVRRDGHWIMRAPRKLNAGAAELLEIPLPDEVSDVAEQRTYAYSAEYLAAYSRFTALTRYELVIRLEACSIPQGTQPPYQQYFQCTPEPK